MHKTALALLLLLCLLLTSAHADPLTLAEDLAGVFCWPDGTTPETASYTYEYHLPQVVEDSEAAIAINGTYRYQMEDTAAFGVPMKGEMFAGSDGVSCTVQTYRICCNSDEIFSVLQTQETVHDGARQISYSAHTFGRSTDKPNYVLTLPYLLDILEDEEMDDWLKDRQTLRASECVRQLIWDEYERRLALGEDLPEDLTEEDLLYEFYPEEDFYYDEATDSLVFFLQPYLWGDESDEGHWAAFPFTIEEILDEL